MLVDLNEIEYVPMLSVRPAEMVALRELPENAMSTILPHIVFRPWLGSGTLLRAVEKLEHAFPHRPYILELDKSYEGPENSVVGTEMAALGDPNGGFSNWRDFLLSRANAIPCLQPTADAGVLSSQLDNLSALGRGVAVRIPRGAFAALNQIIPAMAEIGISNVLFVLDFGTVDHRFLTLHVEAENVISSVLESFPASFVALAATSFPSSFTDLTGQPIYERGLFSAVQQQMGGVERLIYSDRGSARVHRDGGGGVPAPRIDLPSRNKWDFFRKDLDQKAPKSVRLTAYKEMAELAVASEEWDPSINIWGTQMVHLTRMGSEYGITSPVKATAARINIHLFKQAFFDHQGPLDALLEDDWED